MPSQPSLLVFTRDPEVECARRRLLPRRFDRLGRRLLRQSLVAALDAGRATGCRLEVSSPRRLESGRRLGLGLGRDVSQTRQEGTTFGARFRHAVRVAFGRTSGPLVVVGSDIPGLTEEHLGQALHQLAGAPDRVVLGPSPDGGFYLVAANRPLDDELAEVSWCGRDTLEGLLTALRRSGREVILLAPLRDLDRAQDLAVWLKSEAWALAGWAHLTGLVRRLLADLSRPPVPVALGRLCAGLVPVRVGRGPPR